MNINYEQKDTTLTVALEGRIDTMTAPEVEQTLLPQAKGMTEIIFDLAKVEYISSAGLRVMVKLYKSMAYGGRMKAVNASDIVKEVFEVTGFISMIEVE